MQFWTSWHTHVFVWIGQGIQFIRALRHTSTKRRGKVKVTVTIE